VPASIILPLSGADRSTIKPKKSPVILVNLREIN